MFTKPRLLVVHVILIVVSLVGLSGRAPVGAASVIPAASPATAVAPADVDTGWQARVQAEIARSEYAVTWQEHSAVPGMGAAYQAPNRAQNLRTYFTPQGIVVVPRTAQAGNVLWQWGMRVTGYGSAREQRALASAGQPEVAAERVTYAEAGLSVWYVNDARGLEQGFTLAAPPDAVDSTVVVTLGWTGDLAPQMAEDGAAVEWTTADGVRVLRYDGLSAYDATGAALPAKLELDADVLRLVVDAAGAVYPVTIDPLVSTPNWTAESDQVGANFGIAVSAAGDVNGDGYGDVIVGAYQYDNGELDEGRAYVYHGSASGLGVTAAWTAESNQAGADFGAAVSAAGDVNGDGYGDVIVGAYDYDNGELDEGRAYVYYGSVSGLSAAPAWTAESDQATAQYGIAVAGAGDVNGDGYDDVLVGARWYDNGQQDEGRAYVYHGSAGGLSAAANWTAESDQANAELGWSVSGAGDVNGDGYADVIVGAWRYDNGQQDEGRAAVYHGSAGGLALIANWTAESDQANAYFGIAVSGAGDVNGDGYADVIVGAYWYDNGQTDEGGAFVYHGSASGLSVTPNWTGENDQAYAEFGQSVSGAGDVNGDGYADVLVGADAYSNGQAYEGAAFVYLGSASGPSATPTWAAESDEDGARFGYAVHGAGDVNGDGYADVLVGAFAYANGEANEGRAYVYHGGARGLAVTAGWMAEGNQADANFGYAVSGAGDVNGDGYDDVIVGVNGYDGGQANEGRVYVYNGAPAGLLITPTWTAESNQVDAFFGSAVSGAGDVNGDGYADVIVGAPYYDNGQLDEGRAFVYHGSLSGLGTTPMWTAESNQANAEFGWPVSGAGDVNGDGYADVIVGANKYENGEPYEGRAYVYHGGLSGLGATAVWTAEGNQANAGFGGAVNDAGDVNGDGYADVVVGASLYDNGEADEGRAYVYQGGPSGLSATPAWMAESDQAAAWFGYGVSSAGDVNGDGYADVLVGAFLYDNGEADEGRAYVYQGGPSGLSATAVWTAEGNQVGAAFGGMVSSAGDVNGDGYADVLVGAFLYDNGQAYEGRAYVYQGGPSGLSATPTWTAESDQADAQFGVAVSSAGDVNGDGYADVLVGAPYYDNGEDAEGRAFLYYGNAGAGLAVAPQVWRPSIGLSATAGWSAEGNQDNAFFGLAVSGAGDVNGDGYADVIVGAEEYDNGEADEGRAYVYYGSASGLSLSPDWVAESNQAYARFGGAVSGAGDVNGDGYADVVIGADLYSNGQMNEGRAYVYHGSPSGLAATPAWTAESDQAEAVFGFAASGAGDVNGDGYADVLVGAPYYDSGEADEGRAYAYLGSASGLAATPAWMVEGNQVDARLGFNVSDAGDVNGDGFADVLVGVPQYDNGEVDEGRAYAYLGSVSGLAATPAWTIEGNQAGAKLGSPLAGIGDVNGDGYADVLVSASAFDNGEADEGRVYVYHGSASGLSVTAAWMAEGNQGSAYFGSAIDGAGDVNGDGYADVVIGAWGYDTALVDAGRAYVYHGSQSGLSTLPAWTAEGVQVAGDFSIGVGGAGDVNNDGFADVLIGAYLYDHGQTDEGQVFVYYGQPPVAPVQPGGQVYSPNGARMAALARTPAGRAQVRVQWEVKPENTPFDGTSLNQSVWLDSGLVGQWVTQQVNTLAFETRFHWRMRIQGRALAARPNGAAAYTSRWIDGRTNFFTALSGAQNFPAAGTYALLGQSSTANVTTLGTLTDLTLRGYPQTAHERAHLLDARFVLERYYLLAPNAGAAGYSVNVCLAYDQAEVGALDENFFHLCRWTGTDWSCLARAAASNVTSNLVCADGVSALAGDWVIRGAHLIYMPVLAYNHAGARP